MKKYTGAYLYPITFFNDKYKRIDFREGKFWELEQNSWGVVEHVISHCSSIQVQRDGNRETMNSSNEIFISTDGLIASEIPSCVKSNDEALMIMSNHLTSFLSILNLGGLYFEPISEKDLSYVEFKDNKITQTGASGDQFSRELMERAILRSHIPYMNKEGQIDFNWVLLRIHTKNEIESAYELGNDIMISLNFERAESILFLETFRNYTIQKWNNSLLLGWAFLEILLDRLWKKEILSKTIEAEVQRKNRLDDNRTFSASVKCEILYVAEAIDIKLYNELNNVRRIRNKLIHDGYFVYEDDVSPIFELVKNLIKIFSGLEPKFSNPGRHSHIIWREKKKK